MTINVRKLRTTGRKSGRMSKRGRNALSTILPLIQLSTESVMDKADVFGREAPLYLEIGFGTGAFLSDKAATFPHHDFIGIEIYVTGIAKLLLNLMSPEDPTALSITNVKIFNKDARSVLENNIPPDSLDGVYILFPDPWPKKRHNKRRLITPEFTSILFHRLKAQGSIVVATDSDEYAAEIESSFASAGFVIEGEDLSDISRTAFALKAAKDNRQFQRYRFVKADTNSAK
ncbi:MAG: tRNA (guanosine(46)-N7)-methyltransferase TrmB [Nitrospirae bacterium]|nr:tRNA (guanosine(46)-N7)-methyltransferase TrmB [Nitrospirota bacterium]